MVIGLNLYGSTFLQRLPLNYKLQWINNQFILVNKRAFSSDENLIRITNTVFKIFEKTVIQDEPLNFVDDSVLSERLLEHIQIRYGSPCNSVIG